MVRLFGPKFAGEATRILGAGAALPEIQTALADMRSGIGPSNTIAFLQEGNTNALEFYKSNPGASGFITSFGAKNAGSLVNTAAGLKMPAQAVDSFTGFAKYIGPRNAELFVETIGPADALKIMSSHVSSQAAEYIAKFGVPELGKILSSTGIDNTIEMLAARGTGQSPSLSTTAFAGLSMQVTPAKANEFFSSGGTASFYVKAPLETPRLIENFGGKAGPIVHILSTIGGADVLNTAQRMNNFAEGIGQVNAAKLIDAIGVENAVRLISSKAAGNAANIINGFGLDSFVRFTQEAGGISPAITALSSDNTDITSQMRIKTLSEAARMDKQAFINALSIEDAQKISSSSALNLISDFISRAGLDTFISFRNQIGGIDNAIHAISTIPNIASLIKTPEGMASLKAAYVDSRTPSPEAIRQVPVFAGLAGKEYSSAIINSLGEDMLSGILAMIPAENLADLAVRIGPEKFVKFFSDPRIGSPVQITRDMDIVELAGCINEKGVEAAVSVFADSPRGLHARYAVLNGPAEAVEEGAPLPGHGNGYGFSPFSPPVGGVYAGDYRARDILGPNLGCSLGDAPKEVSDRFSALFSGLGVSIQINRGNIPCSVSMSGAQENNIRMSFNGDATVFENLFQALKEADRIMLARLFTDVDNRYSASADNIYMPLVLNIIGYRIRDADPKAAEALTAYAEDMFHRMPAVPGFDYSRIDALARAYVSSDAGFQEEFSLYADSATGAKAASRTWIKAAFDGMCRAADRGLAGITPDNASVKISEAVFSAVEAGMALKTAWLKAAYSRDEAIASMLSSKGVPPESANGMMPVFDWMSRSLFGGDGAALMDYLSECGIEAAAAYCMDRRPFKDLFTSLGPGNHAAGIRIIKEIAKTSPRYGINMHEALYRVNMFYPDWGGAAEDYAAYFSGRKMISGPR